jgi:DNA-binding HxlR family transcriptional regulator
MVGQQQYNQRCPLASGLDVVGSRWALLVVRELMLGPRRFSEVQAELQGASTDMVAVRLKELMASGLIERSADRAYALTDTGFDLAPVVAAVNQWVFGHPEVVPFGAETGRADMTRRLATLLAITARTSPLGDHGAHVLAIGALRLALRPQVDGSYAMVSTDSEDAPVAALSESGLVRFVFEAETSLDDLLDADDLSVAQQSSRSLLEALRAALPTRQHLSSAR